MDVVHGNKAKGKRDEAIKEFREGRVWCLVVTEVLARGMDFRGVKVVINYGESRNTPSFPGLLLSWVPICCLREVKRGGTRRTDVDDLSRADF